MFERFYSIYPRKVARLDAEKAWKQMTRSYDPEAIIAGAEKFARQCANEGKEKEFIPYPASWLRAGRWMDGELNETVKPTEAEIMVRKVETLDELRAWLMERHGKIPSNLALEIDKARSLDDLSHFLRNTIVPKDWRPRVVPIKVRA